MGPHGGHRVAEGGAVLDAQAVDGVGVVAAPDLGGVIEHTGIKPAAPSGAALNEHVGVVPAHPVQQLVHPQDVAVEHLPLPVRRKSAGPHVGEAAVHVPLHIGDIGAVQHLPDGLIDVLPDLPAGEVQGQLAAPPGVRPPRNPQRPVGMGPVEVAVLADHLRLNPDAEGHAQLLDPGHQGLQTAGELLPVDNPVPQTAPVAVSGAEPAVVHDKQLDVQRGGGLGDAHQLVGVEAELGGLPVVNEHRAAPALERVVNQILPDGPVELAAHLAKAAGGADQGRLRGGKGLAGGQRPAEMVGVDPQKQTVVLQLGALRRGQEVAAVYQRGPIAQAVILARPVLAEHHKGVVVVAGGAPDALHTLNALAQRGPVGAPLHHVAAVEGDEVIVAAQEVQAQGGAPAQPDRARPLIHHPDSPGDEVVSFQHPVVQLHQHPGGPIPQPDHKGLPLVPAPEGGQALQAVFALPQLTAREAQVGQTAAVLRLKLDGGHTVVPHAAGGVFLGQRVQGVVPAGLGEEPRSAYWMR